MGLADVVVQDHGNVEDGQRRPGAKAIFHLVFPVVVESGLSIGMVSELVDAATALIAVEAKFATETLDLVEDLRRLERLLDHVILRPLRPMKCNLIESDDDVRFLLCELGQNVLSKEPMLSGPDLILIWRFRISHHSGRHLRTNIPRLRRCWNRYCQQAATWIQIGFDQLGALVRARCLRRKRFEYLGPLLYWLTKEGAKVAGEILPVPKTVDRVTYLHDIIWSSPPRP